MTDIIIKRYRPEEFPRHLDFLERMTVTKGTVEDWHALKSLHYKTDGKPFAPTTIAANLMTVWWASWLWLTRNYCWHLATACFLS